MTSFRALLTELAVPRLAGTLNNETVRATLKRELGARGFVVMEHRFTASPRGIWVVTACGRALAVTASAVGAGILLQVRGLFPQLLLLSVLTAFLAHALGAMTGILPCPWPSAAGVNLIGVRPRTRISVWLTAHHDSKGQAMSMAGRLAAVCLAAAGSGALLVLAVLHLLGRGVAAPLWLPFLAIAALGGQRLARSRPHDASPGAVDNASGVLAVLAAVDALPPDAPVGVILPDGEEFGLEGARAIVRERANLFGDTAVLNFDGIDDRGGVVAFMHRGGPVVDAVVSGLGARRWRRLPVLVDGIAFAQAARECVTIMKGGWQTMRVVHRPTDTADRLQLDGVKAVAAKIAASLPR
ncbi:MAG: M28 family peptidase [Gemmatimonadetes bacterium]|nr:M28 family peptidase [Gemmatimonadota bacterium]